MTTEEIKTLIDQKIAGQGNQVDLAGALPTILKEIIDSVGKAAPETLVITSSGGELSPTQEEIDRIIPMIKDNTIYNYVIQQSADSEFRGRVVSTSYEVGAYGQPTGVFMTVNFTKAGNSRDVVITLLD